MSRETMADPRNMGASYLNPCEGDVEVDDVVPPVAGEVVGVVVTLLKIAASGEFGGNFNSSACEINENKSYLKTSLITNIQ